MGYAMAEAAIAAGHDVVLVSGPVELPPPTRCEFHAVETTSEMLEVCRAVFPNCDGVIAAAAVCDYKPKERISGKIAKTGAPVSIEMIETDDVLAELGRSKTAQWVVGFALEAHNPRENALQKLRAKNCDVVVLNAPTAIGSEFNSVELLDGSGNTLCEWSGPKTQIAQDLIGWVEAELQTT